VFIAGPGLRRNSRSANESGAAKILMRGADSERRRCPSLGGAAPGKLVVAQVCGGSL
jgi:hypothetical protein